MAAQYNVNAARPNRPVWLPVLVYLVLMPAMLWLGFWQLDKAGQQEQRLNEFAQADSTPLAFSTVDDPRALRYRSVSVRGYFDARRQFLIDNIVRNSRNGFYVITPFYTDDGPVLLVNRGWIPQTPTREPIGELSISDDVRRIGGRIGKLPVGGIKLGDATAAGGEWPRILQFPEIADIESQLGQAAAPWVLLADPQMAGGFEREWKPGGLPPERHLGYAVQWFAMSLALTALLIWAALSGRRKSEKTDER